MSQPTLLETNWLVGTPSARLAAVRAMSVRLGQGGSVDLPAAVSLLEQPKELLEQSWFALAHVRGATPSFKERLVSRAESFPENFWAARSLASAGAKAATSLEALVGNSALSLPTRLAAVRGLGGVGIQGQVGITSLLMGSQLPQEQVLLALLEQLRLPLNDAVRQRLLSLIAAGDAGTPSAALICSVRALLASGVSDPELLECAPPQSREHKLALNRVAAQGESDAESDVWRRLVDDADRVVAHRALEQLRHRPRSPHFDEVVSRFLRSEEAADVEVAAELLDYVARHNAPFSPGPLVQSAVQEALTKDALALSVAALARTISAAASVGTLSSRQSISRFCNSPWAALQDAASVAMLRLRGPACSGPMAIARTREPTGQALRAALRFHFGTDVLTIQLSPDLSPVHLDAIATLVDSGHLMRGNEAVLIDDHLLTLGDLHGDGKAETSALTLPAEPDGYPYTQFDVAFGQEGRDGLYPQLQVLLAPRPDFQGVRTRIGRADSAWLELPPGARFERVELIKDSTTSPTSATSDAK